jgi:hypothetical protein
MSTPTAEQWTTIIRGLGSCAAERHDLKETYERVLDRFADDYQAAKSELAFVFDDPLDIEDATRDHVSLLRRWHLQGQVPSMAAMCAYGCDVLAAKIGAPLKSSLMMAAILADLDHPHAYHNNLHFAKVLIQALRMIVVHNVIFDETERALDQTQIVTLMIAACIHDLGHDGQGNTLRGVYEQGRLERRSFEIARPFLIKAGLEDPALLNAIRVMVLCTDVTPLGDPANPQAQAKAAYRYHYLGDNRRTDTLNLDPEIDALEKDADLALMTVLLHEADIATSAGLSYALTKYETILIHAEIDAEHPRPSHIVDFMNKVCQRRMISDAGQKLYAANMARIYALAEDHMRSGDDLLPPADQSEFLRGYGSAAGQGDSKTIN